MSSRRILGGHDRGRRRPAGLDRGFYVEPTVFVDVDNRSVIAGGDLRAGAHYRPRDGEDDAIAKANDSVYSLNAAVFTQDADRAYGVAAALP